MFQVKHWLCDYPWQTPYMLNKFQRRGWVFPLTLHAGVHALTTVTILSIFLLINTETINSGFVLVVGLLDFIVHFVVDRVKAHPDLGGKFKMDNPKFWWALGADQSAHHLTHYFIIYLTLSFI